MRTPLAFFVLLTLPVFAFGGLGCALPEPSSDGEPSTSNEELRATARLLGYLSGTTSGSDFSPEELAPATPGSVVVYLPPMPAATRSAALGQAVTLPASERALTLDDSVAGDVEICATSAAPVKLWLMTTRGEFRSSDCRGWTCRTPLELDETPMSGRSHKVCTRGTVPFREEPIRAVVKNASGAVPVTVTTRALRLASPQSTASTDVAGFTHCAGAPLSQAQFDASIRPRLAGVGGYPASNASREIYQGNIGAYASARRERVCSLFRGCTEWTSSALAESGALQVQYREAGGDSLLRSGTYVAMRPTGAPADPMTVPSYMSFEWFSPVGRPSMERVPYASAGLSFGRFDAELTTACARASYVERAETPDRQKASVYREVETVRLARITP